MIFYRNKFQDILFITISFLTCTKLHFYFCVKITQKITVKISFTGQIKRKNKKVMIEMKIIRENSFIEKKLNAICVHYIIIIK